MSRYIDECAVGVRPELPITADEGEEDEEHAEHVESVVYVREVVLELPGDRAGTAVVYLKLRST